MIETQDGVFTRDRLLTGVLVVLTALSIYVCYRLILPFIPAIAFALALAVATRRPYAWLKRRIGRETVAAALATILVLSVIIVPIGFLLNHIVQLAIDHIDELNGSGFVSMRETLERVPLIGGFVEQMGSRFRIEEQIGTISKAIAARATGLLSSSVAVVTQLGITIFVLFFFYRDCGEGLEATRKLLPLSQEEADRMFEKVGSTIEATVNGSLTIAAIQATLAGVVYALLGVPVAALWGTLTFICALVPVFGTVVVWAPIALYLMFTGHISKGIFLCVWGGAVVGSIDNIMYPWLVGDKIRMHTVPTFFAVLGGLSLFGAAGLIMGPMALAIAIAMLDVWWERTEAGHGAELAISKEASANESEPGQVLQNRSG